MPTSLPDHPWQKVGSDLFALKGANYLIVVDYFSRYPEVVQLKSTTSQSIITSLKSIPYTGKFWRPLNLAKWPEMARYKIWRF